LSQRVRGGRDRDGRHHAKALGKGRFGGRERSYMVSVAVSLKATGAFYGGRRLIAIDGTTGSVIGGYTLPVSENWIPASSGIPTQRNGRHVWRGRPASS